MVFTVSKLNMATWSAENDEFIYENREIIVSGYIRTRFGEKYSIKEILMTIIEFYKTNDCSLSISKGGMRAAYTWKIADLPVVRMINEAKEDQEFHGPIFSMF